MVATWRKRRRHRGKSERLVELSQEEQPRTSSTSWDKQQQCNGGGGGSGTLNQRMRVVSEVDSHAWKKWRVYESHKASHSWWACPRTTLTKTYQSKSHNMPCLYPKQTVRIDFRRLSQLQKMCTIKTNKNQGKPASWMNDDQLKNITHLSRQN